MGQPLGLAHRLIACARKGRERHERGVQEPPEPDAFTAPHLADPIHAIVPVARADQRQAVLPNGQAPLQRPRTVFEQRSGVVGGDGLKVRVLLTRSQCLALQKRHPFIQNREVTSRLDVVSGGVRQPDPIISNAGADAGAVRAFFTRRQPPMLDVTLDELSTGCAQQMLARQGGPGKCERHSILELIAESVGAASLIKGGSCPHATDQSLIEHPAIEDDVQGAVRRLHLNHSEHIVPVLNHRAEDRVEIDRSVTDQQSLRLRGARGLTKEKDHFHGLARHKIDVGLQRAARVETRAHPLGQRRLSGKCCRAVERAMSTEKLATVGGPLRLPSGEIRERHVRAKWRVPGIVGEHRACCGVDRRHNERCRGSSRRPEYPFGVGRDGKSSRPL